MSFGVHTTLTPRKRPVQRRAKVTLAVILESAAQVLERSGIDGFTTNAIASRAGVSIGTLYQYYGDKAGIVAALSQHVRTGMIERISEALVEAKLLPLHEGLRVLALASLQADATRPHFARWLDLLEARLGLSGASAISFDQALTGLIADYLITMIPGIPVKELIELADDIRAAAGALANAALRRGDIVEMDMAERMVVIATGLLEHRLANRSGAR